MDYVHLNNMLHNLKQPIDNISSIISVIRTMNDDPAIERYYSIIEDCCRSSRRIVNNMNEMADIKADKCGVYYSSRSIVEYLDYYIKTISPFVKGKGVRLICDFDVSDKSFISDYDKLSKILNNIVGNGAKYNNKAEKTLKISVREAEDGIMFKIEDNGMGIPEGEVRRITEPYFRGSNALGMVSDGGGLGLCIVMEHLDALDGTFKAESKLNVGTTVTITVPNGEATTLESNTPELTSMAQTSLEDLFCTPGYLKC